MSVTESTKAAAASLAKVTYLDEDESPNQKPAMQTALAQIPSDCNGPYHLVWGPTINHGILSFIAQGADGSLAAAFRGTLTSFGDATGALHNILDDLSGFQQVNWQFPLNKKAKVSWGTNDALTFAISSTDHDSGSSMIDFLRLNLRKTKLPLMVTGHSLGGALANVAAVWLHDQIPKDGGPTPTIIPYTFAAPTVTDQSFATLYAEVCPVAYHCVNMHDIVPMAWTNFDGVENSFSGRGPSLSLKGYNPGLWKLVQFAGFVISKMSNKYIDLPGTRDVFEPIVKSTATNYVEEAEFHHSLDKTYLMYVSKK